MARTKRLRKYYYRNKQTKQKKPRQAKTRKLRGGVPFPNLTKMMPKGMPSMPKVMPSMSTLSRMPRKALTTLSNLSSSVSSAIYGKNRPPKTEILEIIGEVRRFNAYVLKNDLGDEFIKCKEAINFEMEYKELNAIFEEEFQILGREDIEKIGLAVILVIYMNIYNNIIYYKKKIAHIIEPIIDDKLSYNKDLVSQPIILNYYKNLAEKPYTDEEAKIQKSNHNCFYQIYYIYMPEIDKFISKIEHLTSKTLMANEFYIRDTKILNAILEREAFMLVNNYHKRYDKTIPDSEKELLAKELCIQQYDEDLDTKYCQTGIQKIIAAIEIDKTNQQLFENLDIAISLLNVGNNPCVVVSALRSVNYYLIQMQAQTFINTIPEQKKQIKSDKTLTSEIQQQKITSLDKLYNQISIIMNIAYRNMPQALLKYEEVQEEEQAQYQKIMTQLVGIHEKFDPPMDAYSENENMSVLDAYYKNISELKEYEKVKYIYGPLINNISYMRYIEYPLKEFIASAEFAIKTKELGYCNIHRRHRLYTSLYNGAERFETHIRGEMRKGEKLSPAMDNILTITSGIKTLSKFGLDNEINIEPYNQSDFIKQEPVPEPVPESVSESKPVPEPILESVSKPLPEPVPESVSESKPVPEPILESVSKPVSEPVLESVSEPVSESVGGKYLHRIMRKKYTKKRQMKRRKM